MRLGIDLGTTRTTVASVDRGNYPVVSFLDSAGDSHEFFPSVVALVGDRFCYGFEALTAAGQGAPLLRSFKRALGAGDVNADSTVLIGDREVPLLDVLTGFLVATREALASASSISDTYEPSTAEATVVAVPAHAHGAQRFLTLEAFRRAGFAVTAMINEPSAAGFEYTHRQGRTLNSKRTRVIVYDLGGGTFDASLVNVDGVDHEIIGSLGLNMLGGDDFDAVLADCALDEAGLDLDDLDLPTYVRLLDDCRDAKEHLSPQSRRIPVEVDARPVTVQVDNYYTRATPLVEASIAAMAPLVEDLEGDAALAADIAGIYLVGGASGLPLVPRLLKDRFGRRVHRSPYPAASTAIGLAIAADAEAGYSLADRLSRWFGVFREGDAGSTVSFDPILGRDQPLPDHGELVITRRYRAAHNVGWYRFVEYTEVDPSGEPRGDIAPFAQIVFPFDAALQRDGIDVESVPVQRGQGPMIEERYAIDANGIVQVRITDLTTGYTRTHAMSRPLAEAA
ncbi:Hsp70 family protein [Raineyella sp. LH-20]|uniref:Hsp70 family protein n=1 Tax=Raineyella sp. LH-20 TaxID=3081204 RepID=UPI002953ACD5|nr:Hsp70 family protein [Raineyella sp. LH-20]WOP18196.1 Hsp70 family protein [Raineyella sp. LH-20]